jgi:hypothetical protein
MNSWAEFATLLRSTRTAFSTTREQTSELKAFMFEDARMAVGHALKGRRSKAGE